MAFPTTSVLDNFNRADATGLGSSWTGTVFTGEASPDIVSNAAKAVGAGWKSAYWNPTTYSVRQEAYGTLGADVRSILCTRLARIGAGTTDGYYFSADLPGDLLLIGRIDNESGTVLGASITGFTGIVSGDSFGAQSEGTTHRLFTKAAAGSWTQQIVRQDSTYTDTGYIGVELNSGAILDDFGGGEVASPFPFVSAAHTSIQSDLTGAASVAVTLPTHQTNDILIVAATCDSGDTMSTATSGWAEITEVDSTDNFAWYWKRAQSAAETSPTITAAGTDLFATAFAVRGCTPAGTPYEDATTAGLTSSTTPAGATITTTGPNRLAVTIANMNLQSAAWSSGPPPSGWETSMDISTTDGTDARFSVITKEQASAGDVTGVTLGTLPASVPWATLSLAFIPATSWPRESPPSRRFLHMLIR